MGQIDEWYNSSLMRSAVIERAQMRLALKDEIDAALDAGDEELFYELTARLRGLE